MRFGVYAPNFGEYADPRRLVSLAREAEMAGWHGFFLYDHIIGDAYGWRPGDDIVDPWVALSAIAATTDHIRLGPLVTPLARRRPLERGARARVARSPFWRSCRLRRRLG